MNWLNPHYFNSKPVTRNSNHSFKNTNTMKKLCSFIVIILFLGINQAAAQNVPISNFYEKYKHGKNTTKISLPGWIVKFGAWIGRKAADDEETKEALKLAKRIRFFRMLQIEDNNPVSNKDVKRLTRKLEKRKFEPWVFIREGSMRTQIMIKEKNGMIKNFFLLVQEDDSFTMVSLKLKLHVNDIKQLIQMLNEEHDIPIADIQ